MFYCVYGQMSEIKNFVIIIIVIILDNEVYNHIIHYNNIVLYVDIISNVAINYTMVYDTR